jgi:hypothetical protein
VPVVLSKDRDANAQGKGCPVKLVDEKESKKEWQGKGISYSEGSYMLTA